MVSFIVVTQTASLKLQDKQTFGTCGGLNFLNNF